MIVNKCVLQTLFIIYLKTCMLPIAKLLFVSTKQK